VASELELTPTIDRGWLERAARDEPLPHAYALWDLERMPDRVRFISAVRAGTTVGYLLVWLGRPDRPVVHWVGGADLREPFERSLPPPPFAAVVPTEIAPGLAARFPRARVASLQLLLRARAPVPEPARARVRRLGAPDREALHALVRRGNDPELSSYGGLDPADDAVWGSFDDERLVGVARAAVRLPRLWVVSGVYVEPSERRRGLASAVVGALLGEAGRAGADVGLYAQEADPAATRLYASLGFREVGRRGWVEVGRPAPG